MTAQKETKNKVITEYRQHESDTGSPEVQVALITQRIKELVEHLKTHKKDHASRRGLLILVGQRKRLMDYLERTAPKRYDALVDSLKSSK